MRGWNAVITVAAGGAVIVVAAACGAGSPAAGPAGSHTAAPARSPATEPAAPKGPQYTMTGVSCASPAACTAVGGAYHRDLHVAPVVLRWNGKTWSMQHAPNPRAHGGSHLTAVSCPRADDCMAVGVRGGYQMGTLAEHWNGKTWSVTPTPLSRTESGELYGVSCSSPDACTAVGDRSAPGKVATLAMRWNGKAWALQSTPSPGGESTLAGVSCPTATVCTAIGSGSVGTSGILAAAWNGRAWTLETARPPAGGPGKMYSVACTSARYCVAVGINYAAAQPPYNPWPGGGLQQPVSLVWDGFLWNVVPVPYPRGPNHEAYLNGVDCSAATACTAVGVYTPGTVGGPTMAERWNGTSWARQDSATPPAGKAQLTSVSCPASRFCMAVGDTATHGLLAERWNGSAWAITPTP